MTTITRDPGNTHGCRDVATITRTSDGWRVTEVHNCTCGNGDWIAVGTIISDDDVATMAPEPTYIAS